MPRWSCQSVRGPALLALCLLAGLAAADDTVPAPRPAPAQRFQPTQPPGFFERLFGLDRPVAPAPVPAGDRHLVIVCGLSGGDEFRERFTRTTSTLIDVLTTRGGFDNGRVQLYLGDELMLADGELKPYVKGEATAETLEALAKSLTEDVKPADTLWLIVLGHSYFDGRRVWINLPERDINEETFGEWFADVGGRESVFWITTPASGFFIRPLSRPGRIIITATEADREVIATEFPHMLADVLASPPAPEQQDQDGDGRLSLLDLYLLTARRVGESFQQRELVATEHARLDDNGDRRGREVQRDYLPPDLEGTLGADESPQPRTADREGAFASGILLPDGLLTVPTRPDDAGSSSSTDSEPPTPGDTPATDAE